MILKEKLLLEEPEDEVLPPAIPEEPIVVSTEPEEDEPLALDVRSESERPDDEIVKNAFSSLVMDEISHAYDGIGSVNALIASLASEDADAYSNVIEDLDGIVDDLTVIVGKLHGILAKVDPESGELIYDGMTDVEGEEIEERITRGDRRLTKETNKHN